MFNICLLCNLLRTFGDIISNRYILEMKEQVAGDTIPNSSQIEPPRKKIRTEEEDLYHLSDFEVQRDSQFVKVSLKEELEDVNEYEEECEEEICNEFKNEQYEEEEEEECDEDEFEEEYLEEDHKGQKEITTQDLGFLGTTDTSSPSSLSIDENPMPLLNTSSNTVLFWSPNPPPYRPDFSFCGQSGLIKVPSGNEPHHFFNLLFTDELFQLLVYETNAFAEELFLRQDSNSESRISPWKNTSMNEMKIFLGLLFHMGIIKINRLSDYWNRNRKFDLKYFQTKMSKSRWLILLQAFHLARSPVVGDPVPVDPLFKIRPLLELFHKNMKTMQDPAKNVCIDESVIPGGVRISSCQYIPNKNIKLYMLTEPDGLIHRFLIYTSSAHRKVCGLEHARKVILKLMSGLLGEGRSVYVNSHYTSVNLASYLSNQQTYVTGTLRASRKNNPSDISTVKLKSGELVQWWSQNGINVTKWKDKRDILTISTEFSGDLVNISGRQVGIKKPQVVVEYNKNMRGIDYINQSLSYYTLPCRMLRWYKKFSFHIFELMLLNCYILYRRSSGTCRFDLYDFRLAIVEYLCGSDPPVNLSEITIAPNVINRTHFPWGTEMAEGKTRRKQRRCRYCATLGIRTHTTTCCRGCSEKPALCRGNMIT